MKRLFTVACIAASLAIGFGIGRTTLPSIGKVIEIRHQGNYKFTNPLLECDSTSSSSDQYLVDLRTNLNTLIDQLTADHQLSFASVYYRDLNNGPWFGINENELFSPASLAKVPLAIAFYKLSESDPSLLSQEVEYLPVPIEDQNIVPSITLVPDQKYTIQDLIFRMIVYSDNESYRLLSTRMPADKLIEVYNDLGVDISKAKDDPTGNIIPVISYASFFRILYNSSYLNKDSSEKILQLLSQVEYKKALVAGIPSGITVSHKFGERHYLATGEYQLHDCGIVYLPGHPYLACIMTRGNGFDSLASAIRQISASIYNTVK